LIGLGREESAFKAQPAALEHNDKPEVTHFNKVDDGVNDRYEHNIVNQIVHAIVLQDYVNTEHTRAVSIRYKLPSDRKFDDQES
jgi:hypothetical protein